jgi:hypothetical protein
MLLKSCVISKLKFDAQVTVELSIGPSDAAKHFSLFSLTSLKLHGSTFSNDSLKLRSHVAHDEALRDVWSNETSLNVIRIFNRLLLFI